MAAEQCCTDCLKMIGDGEDSYFVGVGVTCGECYVHRVHTRALAQTRKPSGSRWYEDLAIAVLMIVGFFGLFFYGAGLVAWLLAVTININMRLRSLQDQLSPLPPRALQSGSKKT